MIDDGLLVPRHRLLASVELGRDRWDQYWEGSRRRTNDNSGTLTTRTVTGIHYRSDIEGGKLHGARIGAP